MAFLIVPEKEELSFRKKLHESKGTMAYAHGTEAFPENQWDDFYHRYVQADPKDEMYRLVFCDGCMQFTAETSWKKDPELNGYLLDILVKGDMRREGYGEEALRLMKGEAISHDIHTFYARVTSDNQDGMKFLEHEGFQKIREEHDKVLYRLDF